MAYVYRIDSSKKKSFFSGMSVNTILIGMNVVAFFVFMILIGYFGIDIIALNPANVLGGNYLWTFLTSMFMHGGIFHLFANMFSLMFVGSLIERILGAKRYLYFYLLSGLFAGMFFVLSALIFNVDLNSYAVGASGALFGLVGLLMLLTPDLPVYVMFIPIPIKMKYAAPGILLVLWLISVAGDVPIGNTAHLGGLIAGLFYGVYLKTRYRNKVKYISQHFK